jgi:hypothetical protein
LLPKIDKPLFKEIIPSTGEEILFRPMLVKEEKILLFAQQSGEEKDISLALKQVINNVVQKENFNIDSLCIFDLEYLFLKIRAKSVNNIVKVTYVDLEDEQEYSFEIDLDNVEMLQMEVDKNIPINENVGLIMKYPSASILDNLPKTEDETEVVDYLIASCIDKIYTEDEVYEVEDTPQKEVENFINDLSIETYNKIKEFFNKLPKMYYKLEYKNSLGSERKIELRKLSDFFHWG